MSHPRQRPVSLYSFLPSTWKEPSSNTQTNSTNSTNIFPTMEPEVADRDVPIHGVGGLQSSIPDLSSHHLQRRLNPERGVPQERRLSGVPYPSNRLPRPEGLRSPEFVRSPPISSPTSRLDYRNTIRPYRTKIPSRASLSPAVAGKRYYTGNMERPSPRKTTRPTSVAESSILELPQALHAVKIPQMRQSSRATSSSIHQTKMMRDPVVSPVPRARQPQATVGSPFPRARQSQPTVGSSTRKIDSSTSRYNSRSENRTPRTDFAAVPNSSPTHQKSRMVKQSSMSKSTSRANIVALAVSSPSLEKPDMTKERRFVSTPSVLPSHKKENLNPRGLLRPISPTQAQVQVFGQSQPLESFQTLPSRPIQPLPAQPLQPLQPRPALTKSRTVNALSNIKQTFTRSRSSLNLQPRQSSSSSSHTIKHIDEDDTEYTPDNLGPYMWGFHPTAEWLGRFVAVDNRFRNEFLQMLVEDGPALQEYMSTIGKYPELSKPKSERAKDYTKAQSAASEANSYRAPTPPEQTERLKFMVDNEKSRGKRVMEYLAMLCMDDVARKSFLAFQTTYAKVKRMPELMPESSRIEKLLGKVGTKIDSFKRGKANSGEEG